jgi:hypothetical protein
VRSALVVSALILAGGLGCRMLDTSPQSATSGAPALPGQSTGVFTTARPGFSEALNDFVGRHPNKPEQPVEFPHRTHAIRKIGCTEYCHEAVTTGPVAGLPSVRTCMVCHNAIATDRPRIKQITAMKNRGEDFVWHRVFNYTPQAHVKFNHAPHIRAKVGCTTCHGPIGEGTVAQRNVDMNMGFCVNCHNERKAPVDCLTCHF